MKVTLALVQMKMSEDIEQNRGKAIAGVKTAAKKGANIVCFPELFTSPYFPQEENTDAEKYSESIPGKTTDELSKVARENKVVIVAGSIFEKDGGKFYNTAVIINENGALLGKYRKIHIPHDQRFYEQNYFAPGDLGYRVVKTNYGKIGVLICYDQWYPEAARINGLMDADIIFYPTAIGLVDGVEQSEGNWQSAWETIQRGHAIGNSVVVAAVNRVGKEDAMNFWGGSFVCSQFGALLAKGSDKEDIIMATIDLSLAKQIKDGWMFFKHRRPETYSKITEKR
jgi:agmatine deiminase